MMFAPMMRDHFDLFDDMFNEPFFSGNDTMMKTDISEKDGNYVMAMDVPGLKKEDIHISLKDGNLEVSATRNDSHDEKDSEGRVIRQERSTGSYARSFYVGDDVKEEDIHASLKDGVLTVTFPKKDAPAQVENSHYIEIE